jgi:hypothetical protein
MIGVRKSWSVAQTATKEQTKEERQKLNQSLFVVID